MRYFRNCPLARSSYVPINAETAEVDFGAGNLTGFATNRT
jgi:hypothetical protein